MSATRKNLLEAFRSAAGAPESSAREEPPAPVESAEPPPAAPPAERRPAPSWLPWAAAVGVAFVVGVALGRASSRMSLAGSGESEAESGAEAAVEVPAGLVPRRGERPGSRDQVTGEGEAASSKDSENALLDPENRYTLIVATYGRSHADLAWATRDQLADQGLEVFDPWQRERDILVLVGASPTREALQTAETRVRDLAGWDGKRNAYADAYVELIDRLIDREN